VARTASGPALADDRFNLLSALDAAHWEPADLLQGADDLWIDLIGALIDRGQVDNARKVAARITRPDTIIRLRIERRYDPVTSADPARFDIAKAQSGYTAYLSIAIDRPDAPLTVLNTAAAAMLESGQLKTALAVLDAGAARATPADASLLGWTQSVRANALLMLGHGDGALAAASAAGSSPAAQINLASVQVRLGHAAEALAILAAVKPGGLNGYGDMIRLYVDVQARVDMHDQTGLDASLSAMKARAADGPGVLILAQLSAGETDGAAQGMISMLSEPALRDDALMLLQDGLVPDTAAPFAKQRRDQIRALAARPDVKAAVDKVGRILTLPMISNVMWL
jgi:hypothetical protein